MLGTAPLLVGPSAALDLVLGRLLDALVESVDAADFLCFILVTWEAESAASSPEASRDDGWRRSAVVVVALCTFEGRFLFPETDDEGDDMADYQREPLRQ